MSIKAAHPTIEHVERLVDEHRQLTDEPLLLAIYFEPRRNTDDIYLFEVVEGFGAGNVDEDRELFEVVYASTPSFRLAPGQRLHLILTSPEEFEVAHKQAWPSLEEIKAVVKAGDSMTLFSHASRPDLDAKING